MFSQIIPLLYKVYLVPSVFLNSKIFTSYSSVRYLSSKLDKRLTWSFNLINSRCKFLYPLLGIHSKLLKKPAATIKNHTKTNMLSHPTMGKKLGQKIK